MAWRGYGRGGGEGAVGEQLHSISACSAAATAEAEGARTREIHRLNGVGRGGEEGETSGTARAVSTEAEGARRV